MNLDKTQLNELEELIETTQSTESEVCIRAQIIIACAKGSSAGKVASLMKLSRGTIQKWKKRYIELGIDGLCDRPRPPKVLTLEKTQEIVKMTLSVPPQGMKHWEAKYIATRCEVPIKSVRTLWKKMNIDPKMLGAFHRYKNTPQLPPTNPTAETRSNDLHSKLGNKKNNPDKSPPNIKTLAQLSGFSTTTVSLALKNHSKLAASTRKAIQQLARKLNYEPNTHAIRLVKQRETHKASTYHANLAVLVGHKSRNPLIKSISVMGQVEALQAEAERRGYSLASYWIHSPNYTPQRLDEILRAQGIEGLILLQMNESEIDFPWENYACSYLLPWKPGGPLSFPQVAFNKALKVAESCKKAKEQGYTRLGHIFPNSFALSEDDYRATIGTIHSYQGKIEIPIYELKGTTPASRQSFHQWFMQYKPDVIIAPLDRACNIVLNLLKSFDISVPQDCGVILSNDFEADYFTTLLTPYKSFAKLSLNLAIEQLHNNYQEPLEIPQTIITPFHWYEGKTLPKRIPPTD